MVNLLSNVRERTAGLTAKSTIIQSWDERFRVGLDDYQDGVDLAFLLEAL